MKQTFILSEPFVYDNCVAAIRKLPLNEWEVVIQEKDAERSTAQNNLMWMWLTQGAGQVPDDKGVFHDKNWWHKRCRMKWIGYDVFEIDGVVITEIKSTTKLGVKSMSNYLSEMEAFFVAKGARLTFPDIYEYAMRG